MSLGERGRSSGAVMRLTEPVGAVAGLQRFPPGIPSTHSGSRATPEGDVRRAFFLSYDDTLRVPAAEQIEEKLEPDQWCRPLS